jgi:hypothetical protein
MLKARAVAGLAVGLVGMGLIGCGGSSSSTTAGTAGGAASGAGGALSAEAQSAATGDIPDNQVFLTFRDRAAGFSLRYPEGWAQRGSGNAVTFQDKNNVIRVVVRRGSVPTPAAVAAELASERAAQPSLSYAPAATVMVAGAPVVKVRYSTVSAPNPVTGKSVQLLVDRYVYAHGGKVATLDLGTARGVDNVDAYRMISESFRWQ